MRRIKQTFYDTERKIQHIVITDEDGQVIEEKTRSYGRAFLRLDPVTFYSITADLSGMAHKLAGLILRNVQHRDNICYLFYDEFRNELGASKTTMTRVFDELYEVDFIRRRRNGQVMLNPLIAVGCDERMRSDMINDYFSLPQKQTRRRGESQNDTRSRAVREADREEQTDAGGDLHTATHGRQDQDIQSDVQSDPEGYESEPADDSEST